MSFLYSSLCVGSIPHVWLHIGSSSENKLLFSSSQVQISILFTLLPHLWQKTNVALKKVIFLTDAQTEFLSLPLPLNHMTILLENLSVYFFLLVGWDWVPRYLSPWYCGRFGLLYKPQMIDEDDFWSNWWNDDWQGKRKYSEKTCPSATLSTTKSHMTRPGARTPDRSGGKPATNCLGYGAA
jgi:hypothetical protein